MLLTIHKGSFDGKSKRRFWKDKIVYNCKQRKNNLKSRKHAWFNGNKK